MATQHLFQLGMDLATGTTQTEDRTVSEETSSEKVVNLQSHLESEERQDHFVRREGKVYAGTHLIIEVLGATGLDDPERIETAFHSAIKACGATLLHMHLHRFTPQGVSGVAVLAESHISVHTWPEAGYGAFDVFMCGDADPWQAVPILREAFEAEDVKVTELLRGEGIVG